MKGKLNLTISLCVLTGLFFYAIPMVKGTDAAYFHLEPSAKSVRINEEFDVLIKINTEGAKPTTADALLTYDKTALTLVKVIRGSEATPAQATFFPDLIVKVSPGKIYTGGYIPQGSTPKAGSGLMAILRFKGIKEAQAVVKFMCTPGGTTDSNISHKKAGRVADAIECNKVVNGVYAVSTTGTVTPITPTQGPLPTGIGGAQATPTLIPTGTVTATASPTLVPTAIPTTSAVATATPTVLISPSVLPETGIIRTTGFIIFIGLALTFISILVKTYVS